MTTNTPYDKLPEAAKERLRDRWRENEYRHGDNYWSECIVEEWVDTILPMLGIDVDRDAPRKGRKREPTIYWSGFSSQGDGASFSARYEYKKGAYKAIREYAPNDKDLHELAYDLWALQKKNIFSLSCKVETAAHHYCHSGCMRMEWIESPHKKEVSDETSTALLKLLRRAADLFYAALEEAYDYHTSDENIDEYFIANGYEHYVEDEDEDEG